MACIMDYPTAWAFIREQHSDSAEHDPRCSWVQAQGGILCDCHVINAEYERRRATIEDAKVEDESLRWAADGERGGEKW
jgi:hypothetical protein